MSAPAPSAGSPDTDALGPHKLSGRLISIVRSVGAPQAPGKAHPMEEQLLVGSV